MRKVTKNTVSAFLAGQPCVEGNSHTDGKNYFLFGNKIAERDEHGTFWLKDCSWRTQTTMDRLNGILTLAGSPKYLFQRAKKWYVGDRRDHSSYEWTGLHVFSIHEMRAQ